MKVCILGAGSYGLALALAFYKNNNDVTVWTKVESEKEEIINYRENRKALPGVSIPEEIKITTNLNDNYELIVIAIPINYFRSVCEEIKNSINSDTILCIASKGIEKNTNLFPHEVLNSIIETNNIAILSGPTFAIDLAKNSPSGLVCASTSINIYKSIKNCLESNTLKITYTNDLIGTEICGSIKNVMAILSGLLEGIKITETTKALFLTEALNETSNFIETMNGNKETSYTLAGLGDLILTCTSKKSRNYTLGTLIATENKSNIDNYILNNTVEGYYTLIAINEIIKKKEISVPLVELLYKILFEGLDKKEIFNLLIKN
ncbi:MAG: NAD(P)H-dependent glycerol-3-phosphate dehydrogenase [Tenericutes bacterium]|nr:NAD(P)H-dependent glycerol-3-phosphate dehydrogenase [Mycoplasmatota bacterium]